MRARFCLSMWILLALPGCSVASAQAPTGAITSININQDPVVIVYDLVGSTEEEYEVTLFIMKENDESSKKKLEGVSGDVGVGRFAGLGRRILWKKSELRDPEEGVRYQFALEIRQASGFGIPWYFYPGAVVAGVGVWLAVKHPASTAPSPEAPAPTIPRPPDRP